MTGIFFWEERSGLFLFIAGQAVFILFQNNTNYVFVQFVFDWSILQRSCFAENSLYLEIYFYTENVKTFNHIILL